MNKLISLIFIFAMMLSGVALAAPTSIDYCINDSYAQTNFSFDMISDGVPGNMSFFNTEYCSDGCSNTLNACRTNQSGQTFQAAGWIILFVVMMVISGYISRHANGLGLAILSMVILLSIVIGAVTDIFSGYFKTLFIVFALVPIGYLLVSVIRNMQGGEDEDDD